MQNRYTGDIGDFGKLGLLRQLSAAGFRIGVDWYLTPDEKHNGDGRHIQYLQNKSFAACDRELWRGLGEIISSGVRQVAALERSELLEAAYASEMLDFSCVPKNKRAAQRENGMAVQGKCSKAVTLFLPTRTTD